MPTLRGVLQISWFLRKSETLKRLHIPTMSLTATKLPYNVHSFVVTHSNPSISSLMSFQPKPNEHHLRRCYLLY